MRNAGRTKSQNALFSSPWDVILEAEYIGDRHEHPEYQSFKTKNVKDVLGALYLEKAFTDRFSLSAGFHSYGSSRDFMLSGNLVGRIN